MMLQARSVRGPGGPGPLRFAWPPCFFLRRAFVYAWPPMDRAGPCCKIFTLRGCQMLFKCKCKYTYNTLIERPLTQRCCMQLSWHCLCCICQKVWPNTVFRPQQSVNLHAQLQPLCSAALVPNVLPWRNKGLGKPCAVIEANIVY